MYETDDTRTDPRPETGEAIEAGGRAGPRGNGDDGSRHRPHAGPPLPKAMARDAVRVALYVREAGEGRGAERQHLACRRAAALLAPGHVEAATFEDRAHGHPGTARPGLEAMLSSARLRAFDVVVVENVDRLSRDGGDLDRILAELEGAGIALMSADGGWLHRRDVLMRGLLAEASRRRPRGIGAGRPPAEPFACGRA